MSGLKRGFCGVALSFTLAAPAFAALPVGAKAPDFQAEAAQGGKEFKFDLAGALKKGPVVHYFYPAAFTKGCTIEAHMFAEAIPQFKALGATVIGVSHDSIATLDKFSVSECQSKFPVAADPEQTVIKAYDVVLPIKPEYANRTSYVITPNGKIASEYTAMDPTHHVENTLNAVKAWAAHKG
jgi:peroxiredoxin